MLNINNLNRARRILSAEYGAELSPTSNKRIKYLGKFGDGYKYASSPVDIEDWSSEELSDLPPEEYYKQKTGSENSADLKYAEGLDLNNVNQQSYKELEHVATTGGKSVYYGITSSGTKEIISQSQYNYLRSKGILDRTTETQASRSTSLSSTSESEQPKGLFTGPAITDTWYKKPKEQKKQLEDDQRVPDQEMAKAANSTSTTQTTQPTTPAPQNTTITTPQVTIPQTQGNPSGTDTSTEEQPEKSESFLKGQAIGQKIGAKIGKVLNSEGMKVAGNIGSKVSEVTGALENTLIDKTDFADDDPLTNGKGAKVFDTIQAVGAKFGPVGNAIAGVAGAVKLANGLIKIGKSQDFAINKDIETVAGAYGGTYKDLLRAQDKAGKSYGFLGFNAKRKANKFIDRARIKQYAMQGIADDARDLNSIRSYMDPYYLQYESDMSGGYDQRYMHVAKLGGTLTLIRGTTLQNSLLESFKKGGTIEFKAEITGTEVYDSWEPVIDFDEISLLKEGGSIKQPEIEVIETNTVQKSVIPDGALHKNKHNLDKVGVDDKEMTKKGIPVVDNNGEQQAEIELNEIIFTLEVTKELEKRYKEYYDDDTKQSRKDELALEAGKLLWKEIIYNTDDRTGLIDTLKHGGSITKSRENNTYQDAIDFYKNLGYNPQNYEFIKSSDLRTEGNKLYVNNDEDAVHELWHFISKNIPDERFQEFYKDLSDSKISELGGDLKFVNRTRNPQEFYDPSELLARLFAAKYKTQGNSYTKEFFKNARSNETKYGYNFRDLLHMYNDDNLVKLFSFKLNNEYKKDNMKKRPFEDWVITVNPDYISPNYDLETAYKYVNPEQIK